MNTECELCHTPTDDDGHCQSCGHQNTDQPADIDVAEDILAQGDPDLSYEPWWL